MKWRPIWRQRSPIILLLLLLLLCALLLVSPLERNLHRSLAGRFALTIFTPLVKLGNSLQQVSYRFFCSLFEAQRLRKENQELKTRMAQLEAETQALREANYLLHQMLGLKSSSPSRTFQSLSARVVGFSLDGRAKTVVVDKGRLDGVSENMPVINEAGLVGFVLRVARRSAEVQLLIDSMTAVGVILEKTRLRGLLLGQGYFNRCQLILEKPAEAQLGEGLITSGLERSIYPQGLKVGEIIEIEKNKYGDRVGVVSPYVDFGRLEMVLIILRDTKDYLD